MYFVYVNGPSWIPICCHYHGDYWGLLINTYLLAVFCFRFIVLKVALNTISNPPPPPPVIKCSIWSPQLSLWSNILLFLCRITANSLETEGGSNLYLTNKTYIFYLCRVMLKLKSKFIITACCYFLFLSTRKMWHKFCDTVKLKLHFKIYCQLISMMKYFI